MEVFEEVKAPETQGPTQSNTRNQSRAISPRESLNTSISAAQKEVQWFEKPVKFTENSQAVVTNLIHLLKRNKCLQHLNLTSTGLTEYMILQIGTSMTRAKSLLSIHFCSNIGSTQRVKDYLWQRIRCMPEQDIIKFPVGEMINELTNVSYKKLLLRQLTSNYEEESEKPIARETIKCKQNMERKRIYSLVNDFGVDDNATESRMIFSRILGHKKDMPGSG